MSSTLEEMPVMPLGSVLFPGASLRLHAFDPAQVKLIQDCSHCGRLLGLALRRGGGADTYLVGTAAKISSVCEYEDGRLDYELTGIRRFRIREFDERLGFDLCRVEPLEELPAAHTSAELTVEQDVREELKSYLEKLYSRQDYQAGIPIPGGPTEMSFMIASLLALDNLEKQQMLEMVDTSERLLQILPRLRAQSQELDEPKLRRVTSAELREHQSLN